MDRNNESMIPQCGDQQEANGAEKRGAFGKGADNAKPAIQDPEEFWARKKGTWFKTDIPSGVQGTTASAQEQQSAGGEQGTIASPQEQQSAGGVEGTGESVFQEQEMANAQLNNQEAATVDSEEGRAAEAQSSMWVTTGDRPKESEGIHPSEEKATESSSKDMAAEIQPTEPESAESQSEESPEFHFLEWTTLRSLSPWGMTLHFFKQLLEGFVKRLGLIFDKAVSALVNMLLINEHQEIENRLKRAELPTKISSSEELASREKEAIPKVEHSTCNTSKDSSSKNCVGTEDGGRGVELENRDQEAGNQEPAEKHVWGQEPAETQGWKLVGKWKPANKHKWKQEPAGEQEWKWEPADKQEWKQELAGEHKWKQEPAGEQDIQDWWEEPADIPKKWQDLEDNQGQGKGNKRVNWRVQTPAEKQVWKQWREQEPAEKQEKKQRRKQEPAEKQEKKQRRKQEPAEKQDDLMRVIKFLDEKALQAIEQLRKND
ncbi:golgin subfamily A member 6-like protein 22 isoform X2 [Penaeus japonicus]|uniref:golgin subfamily A member 6-like protein 22 isoform X2 n=1 Tax=Penaeus japonicus TaxID=27405 RepID=UPI001C71553E|nr:golgin subfamily A member 6-like protein 22 isoform X2 [Penaeus japonicus]